LTYATLEPLWPTEAVAPCSETAQCVFERTGSLLSTFRELCGWRFVGMAVWAVLAAAASMLQPLCLHLFLDGFVTQPDASPTTGAVWGSCLLACSAVRTVADSQMWLSGVRCATRCRAAMYTLLYRKSLTLSLSERQRVGSGEILTRMSVDARRVADVTPWLHCVWVNILTVLGTMGLLWFQVRWAMLAGVLVLVILVPLSLQLVRFSRRLDRKLMDQRDTRTKLMSELLRGIKGIKASAMEPTLTVRVDAARATELKSLRLLQLCEVCQHFLFDALPSLVTGATFASFVLLPAPLVCATASQIDGRCTMGPALVFTTLSLLDMLNRCFMIGPHQIAALLDACVSFERVLTFMRSEDAPCVLEQAMAPEPQLLQVCVRGDTTPRGEEAEIGTGREGALSSLTGGLAPLEMPSDRAATSTLPASTALADPVIEMRGTWCRWAPEKEASAAPPAICDATLSIANGELIAIVGPVGSGKSALLLSMLRELRVTCGTVSVKATSTAYCPQDSILRTGSVRDNILWGAPFDLERYKQVIEACALETDLRQLARGDLTLVGERGITMSGGQRQRISLARAAYSEAPLVLLDDPLSAVDRTVAEHLHKKLLRGLLRGRTVVVATHALAFIGDYDRVVVMQARAQLAGQPEGSMSAAEAGSDIEGGCLESELAGGGRIQCVGPARELRQMGIELDTAGLEVSHPAADALGEASGLELLNTPAEGQETSDDNQTMGTDCNSLAATTEMLSPLEFALVDDSEDMEEAESTAQGAVSLAVLHHYLRDAGGWPVLLPLAALLLAAPSVRSVSDAWLASWSDSFEAGAISSEVIPDDHASNLSASRAAVDLTPLEIYLGLAMATAMCCLGVLWTSMYAGYLTTRSLHCRLLATVLATRQIFFDATPHGRVLNRFSSDQTKIDRNVPYAVRDSVRSLIQTAAKIVVQAYVMKYYALLLMPVLYVYVIVCRFYRPCGRELERLSSTALSPVYQRFAEALTAGPLVRAFKRGDQHEARNAGILGRAMCCTFNKFCAERWLSFTMEMLGCAIIGSVVIFAMIERSVSGISGGGSSGFVALALSYAISTAGGLNNLLNTVLRTEQNLVAVERNLEYCQLESEEKLASATAGKPRGVQAAMESTVSAQWPARGTIVFTDVVLRYRPTQPPSLRGVSFTIGCGERVGIVGRSGSGKSTLLTALLRLVELESGTILIDGVDIASVRLSSLRSGLAVIMQDAVLFQGDMRSNLNPQGIHEDAVLRAILQRVSLATDEDAAAALLDASVGESGDNWSNGQRQLICCARALLKRARILLLDEATSSIDPRTDEALQAALRIECEAEATTTMTIAHRLDTIIDSDRVLVMDGGELAESGPPDELAATPTSKFAALLAAKHG